jgi:hypothetical protein
MRRILVGIVAAPLMLVALVGSAVVVAPLAPSVAGASVCDTSWRAAVSGRWDDASNWTHGVPDSPFNACITVSGSYTVSVRGGAYATTLTLGGVAGRQVVDIAGTCRTTEASLTVGDPLTSSHIEPHGVLRMHDLGCNASATLEADSHPIINRGLIDIEASSPDARRQVYGGVLNRGALRIGGAAALNVSGGIDSARKATLQMRLTSAGLPSMSFQDPDPVIPRTLEVMVDPSFVPTHRVSWTFCSNCFHHPTQITGTDLPGGFVLVFHFRRSHQLAYTWDEATIRPA